MDGNESFPKAVLVLGQEATAEWLSTFAQLNPVELTRVVCTGQLGDLDTLAADLESFYAFSFTDVTRAFVGLKVENPLDKIVVLDDSFIDEWLASIVQKVRRRRRGRLRPTKWRIVPALLELMPTTFVAITASDDESLRDDLTAGGVDVIFNYAKEDPGILIERLKARRQGIRQESDFSASRQQIHLMRTVLVGVILAPLIVALFKETIQSSTVAVIWAGLFFALIIALAGRRLWLAASHPNQ